MATPNELYNARWQREHDRHAGARDDIIRVLDRFASHPPPNAAILRQKRDEEQKKALASFARQFRTVEGYALWRLGIFYDNAAAFSCVGDVDRAWDALKLDRTPFHKKLAEGNPAELKAFRGIVVSKYHDMTVLNPARTRVPVHAVVAKDYVDGHVHICFIDIPGDTKSKKIAQVPDGLATEFFRREIEADRITREHAETELSFMQRVWRRHVHVPKDERPLTHDKVHFYNFVPAHNDKRERFSEIIMRFDGERQEFESPVWKDFLVLPHALRLAHLTHERDCPKPAPRKTLEQPVI